MQVPNKLNVPSGQYSVHFPPFSFSFMNTTKGGWHRVHSIELGPLHSKHSSLHLKHKDCYPSSKNPDLHWQIVVSFKTLLLDSIQVLQSF